jgi:hypothetical protein
MMGQGISQYYVGNLFKALELAKSVMGICEGHSEAMKLYAKTLLQLGLVHECKRVAVQLIHRDPSDE